MIIESPHISQDLTVAELKLMPLPGGALMCPPDWFDVVDVKNPFMQGQRGKVDRALAKQQWMELRDAFASIGVTVHTDAPVAACEDMVFCANPIFTGLDGAGARVCALSHMRYASRRPEVAAHANWFRAHGYRVVPIGASGLFEGGGDAIWHPGRRLIWGGYGQRTSREVYEQVSEIFDAPVLPLELRTELFYHLDTCFCPVDERTVVLYPPALTSEGLNTVRRMFECLIEVDEYEAAHMMACNAAPFWGKYVILQPGSTKVVERLRERGFEVIEVDTSEFIKSGGSVFCMKTYLF